MPEQPDEYVRSFLPEDEIPPEADDPFFDDEDGFREDDDLVVEDDDSALGRSMPTTRSQPARRPFKEAGVTSP